MKYAHYDIKTTKVLGWYDPDIHDTIPTPNLQITDEKWQQYVSIDASVINGELIKYVKTLEESQTESTIQLNATSVEYLNETDWYVTRFIETGIEVPADITQSRVDARVLVEKLPSL